MPQVTPTTSQPPLGAATAPSSSSSYFAPGTTSAAASTSMRPPSRSGSPAGRSGAAGSGAAAPVALLSREDLIQKSKQDQARAALNPDGAEADGAGGVLLAGGGTESDCDLAEEVVVPKPIFIISDCTGERRRPWAAGVRKTWVVQRGRPQPGWR